MKAHNLARELGVTFEELQALPSGSQLRKASQGISAMVQRKLKDEMQGSVPTQPPGSISAPLKGVSGHHHKIEPRPASGVEEASNGGGDHDGGFQVFSLARELLVPSGTVVDWLREVTGQKFGWDPNTFLSPGQVERLRSHCQAQRNHAGGRSAGTATRPSEPRPVEKLHAARIRILSDKPTRGETVIAEAIQRLEGTLAFVCVEFPNGANTVEIDALVIGRSFVAAVEVKDTMLSGIVTTYLNGPWEVDGRLLHEGRSNPAKQVMNQARAIGSCRQAVPDLRRLPRVPGCVAIHGAVTFEKRPVHTVGADCYAFSTDDAVEALKTLSDRLRGAVTVAHVQALMEWLNLSRSFRFTREELGLLGFPDTRAV